jgi:hypothetical protein
MSINIHLGAIDILTNLYVPPMEAKKENNYKCVECENKVIIRKGNIRRAHFAHYAQTNICSYYDHPNESQIHKDAKLLMAKLLSEKKRIQFCYPCSYPPCYNTSSECNAFSEVPSIVYQDGDEVKLEYRDRDNKWVADVAIVNNGVVRYIIEIKHTHKTITHRPEPWFEVDATQFILDVNSPEHDEYRDQDFIYLTSCQRTDIIRYCYGSFCYKERWVNKIPGYYDNAKDNSCLFCKSNQYFPTMDGCTGKFQNGQIRVCINCLLEDTYKKRIRLLYENGGPLFRS